MSTPGASNAGRDPPCGRPRPRRRRRDDRHLRRAAQGGCDGQRSGHQRSGLIPRRRAYAWTSTACRSYMAQRTYRRTRRHDLDCRTRKRTGDSADAGVPPNARPDREKPRGQSAGRGQLRPGTKRAIESSVWEVRISMAVRGVVSLLRELQRRVLRSVRTLARSARALDTRRPRLFRSPASLWARMSDSLTAAFSGSAFRTWTRPLSPGQVRL